MEKRILADGRAILYRGDSLELLAAGLLKCDAIVSDPPYGIGFVHGGGGLGGTVPSAITNQNIDPIIGDNKPFDPSPWISAAPKTAVKHGIYGGELRIILWGADNYRRSLPDGGTLLAWDKHIGQGPDDSFADCEWAWCGKKVKREVFRWLWKGIVCQRHADDYSPTKGGKGHGAVRFARVHVSQKPVALMRWCIEKLKPPPGGIISDPYMGSGATAIAALSLGYRFVGVEIDSGHFDTACTRIDAWWAEVWGGGMTIRAYFFYGQIRTPGLDVVESCGTFTTPLPPGEPEFFLALTRAIAAMQLWKPDPAHVIVKTLTPLN